MKKRYSLDQGIERIAQQAIFDFNNSAVELDELLYFYSVKHLKDENPDYVVRFKKGCLKLPSEPILSCVNPDYKLLGNVKIEEVLVSTIDSLTDEDACSCYFESKEDLIETFSRIHQHQFASDDIISIYKLVNFFEVNNN